jgi:hypothetical protein
LQIHRHSRLRLHLVERESLGAPAKPSIWGECANSPGCAGSIIYNDSSRFEGMSAIWLAIRGEAASEAL